MKNQTYLKIELKYCERCGGLWFRREGTHQVYCNSCAPGMARMARGPRKQSASARWQELHGGAVCA